METPSLNSVWVAGGAGTHSRNYPDDAPRCGSGGKGLVIAGFPAAGLHRDARKRWL